MLRPKWEDIDQAERERLFKRYQGKLEEMLKQLREPPWTVSGIKAYLRDLAESALEAEYDHYPDDVALKAAEARAVGRAAPGADQELDRQSWRRSPPRE